MLGLLKKALFGEHGGLKRSEIDITRDKFSTLFPWVSYDPDDKFYFLRDNSVGWIWECSPMLFADDNAFNMIKGIMRNKFPSQSVIQFSLYADPFIAPILDRYKKLRYTNKNISDIHMASTDNYADFLAKSTEGMWQLSGTPVRNYRLFLSVKIPIKADVTSSPDSFIKEVKSYTDIISNIQESLKILGPRNIDPSGLITLMYRITNPDLDPHKYLEWNEDKPIHKQIIFADTEIERRKDSIRFGNTYAGILTPKNLPRQIDNLFSNDMIGFVSKGSTAIENDINQIQCPFIYTVNITYDHGLKTKFNAKALHNSKLQQGAARENSMGSMVETSNRQQENFWVTQQYADGNMFLRVIPQLILFENSEEELMTSMNRVKSVWDVCGVDSQRERDYLTHVMFVAGLPLGLYASNVLELDRDFPVETTGAALLSPIQASFAGVGEPNLLYIDRRGQLVSLDIFRTGSNKNFFVTGGTGAGKSFFMNDFVNSYMGVGAKFRIVTVCDSYRKSAYLNDGQYIEHEEKGMVVNFFEEAGTKTGVLTQDVVTEEISLSAGDVVDIADENEQFCKIIIDKGDTDEIYVIPPQEFTNITYSLDGDSLNMLTGILASMATSRAGEKLDEDELTILETAIEHAFAKKNRASKIDDVIEYLDSIEQHIGEDPRSQFHINTAFKLALRLKKYSSYGQYGKYFNSKSTLSFKSDMVAIDLTKTPEDLRKVFVLAFANIIEREIYKGDRKTPIFVVLDESWQTLSENPYARKFVEGLYRKARKYNASIGIVTQSLHDLYEKGKLGLLGDVIRSQSDFSFALKDKNFAFAYENGILDISEFEYQMLVAKIPARSQPKYSEIYLRTPYGDTIVRLIVDEYKYFVNTSDPDDFLFIKKISEQYQAEGIARKDAMKKAVNKCVEIAKEKGGIGGYREYLNTLLKAS